MNIIIFSSLLLPPSQTFIRAQGEYLQKFTPYYVGSRLVEGLSLPEERTLTVNGGNILGQLEESLFKLTGYAPKIYQFLRQLDPVLIHAQFGLSGVLALPVARSLQVPLLVHYRGADAMLTEQHLYASLNHWLYFRRREELKREATLFITVSKFVKKKLIEQGFPPDKIKAHYHGVDLASFSSASGIPREPVVLFVGRLTEKKGCEDLIRAMSRVQQELPNAELVVIGEGPLRFQLEALAAKSLLRYQFLGLQPPEVVRSWMNRARLLAAPSLTASDGDSEGLPNVVLEAQAMELPVVSTFHAGIPEAVIHEETGLLSAEHDWEKLAEHILQLMNNPDLWQRFRAAGRKHVEVNFDRAKQTKVLEELYLTVLNKDRHLVNSL